MSNAADQCWLEEEFRSGRILLTAAGFENKSGKVRPGQTLLFSTSCWEMKHI